jgi:hypothetical protein
MAGPFRNCRARNGSGVPLPPARQSQRHPGMDNHATLPRCFVDRVTRSTGKDRDRANCKIRRLTCGSVERSSRLGLTWADGVWLGCCPQVKRALPTLSGGCQLTRQALARVDKRGLQMHRLTQAMLRDRLTPAQAATARKYTEAILAVSDPGSSSEPTTWHRWAQLVPHLLAADLATTDNVGLRWMACHACGYLVPRGDIRTAHDLASDLYQRWRDRLGDDHENTLAVAWHFAWVLRAMGRYAEARDLDQDTLDRRQRVLGADHPDALCSASTLAIDLRDLGEVQAARDLDRNTLDCRRRILGADHSDTLESANNLAIDLRLLGEVQAARDLDQDTLDRYRRVLGADHPYALISAGNLASDLRLLGEVQAAQDLDQNILELSRQGVGTDHPNTLSFASSLAEDLRLLGEVQAARDLDQDTLNRRRRVLGKDHPDTLRSASNLADDLSALGQSGGNVP